MYRLLAAAVLWCALAAPTFAANQSFDITAKQFSFSPSTITVTEGDSVTLRLTSADVDHGFSLPAFGVSKQISAGATTSVTFTADTVGTHTFSCSVFCGSGHSGMKGSLVVKEAVAEDTTAPTILSVSAGSVSESTAVISWTTDEAAFGQVEYGTASGSYTKTTTLEATAGTTHTATLSNLSEDTKYFYRVKAEDAEDNSTKSSENNFTTEEDDTVNDNENANTNRNENSNDNSNSNANTNTNSDEDTPPTGVVNIETIGDAERTYTLATNSTPIAFDVNEQLRLTGTATPSAELIIEFCCSVQRFTVVADSDGEWAFQGTPALDSGDQRVTVYERAQTGNKDTVEFEVRDQNSVANSDDSKDEEESEDGGGMFDNMVVWIIIAGIILMVGAGAFFARSMRR
jgi:plastocyanin